jgi:hypothetical protein
LCLDYVQSGRCMVDRQPCLLGFVGEKARNDDRECPRHGMFDVWRTRQGQVLVSDLGGPYEGVEDCYGLSISLEKALEAARTHAQALQTKILTTERKCPKCAARFWPRAGRSALDQHDRGSEYFCESCLLSTPQSELNKYWNAIGTTRDAGCLDLSEWCG